MIREAIKNELKSRNDNIASLARKSGLTQPQLSNYLNGITNLNVASLEKICAVYDLKLIKYLNK